MKKIVGHLGDKFSIYFLVAIISSCCSFSYIPGSQRPDNTVTRGSENMEQTMIDRYNGYDIAATSASFSYLCKRYFNMHSNRNQLDGKNHSQKSSSAYHASVGISSSKMVITRIDFEKNAQVMPSREDLENSGGIIKIWKEDVLGMQSEVYQLSKVIGGRAGLSAGAKSPGSSSPI